MINVEKLESGSFKVTMKIPRFELCKMLDVEQAHNDFWFLISELKEQVSGAFTIVEVEPNGVFISFEVKGEFQSEEEVARHALQNPLEKLSATFKPFVEAAKLWFYLRPLVARDFKT